MTSADKYRKRADELDRAIKQRTGKAAKDALRNKQKALRDLADGEDWLEGKLERKPG